jgi:hypothetical protein
MSTTQLAETAAVSLQNGLSEQFTIGARRDLRDYWRNAMHEAGFGKLPLDYLDLLAFAEAMAGLRKASAA